MTSRITDIYIARHGETEYNRLNKIQGRGIDAPLNETGRRQAAAIAGSLPKDRITHIFCSSLKRSMETAQIIAERLPLEISSYPELDEMDFGIIEGKPVDEITTHLTELHETWKSGNTRFPVEQGEHPEAVLERVCSRMDIIINEYEGQGIVFVLHGRLIRILLSHWLGYGLPAMHEIAHSNAGLYHVQYQNESFKSVFLNQTDHLDQLNV